MLAAHFDISGSSSQSKLYFNRKNIPSYVLMHSNGMNFKLMMEFVTGRCKKYVVNQHCIEDPEVEIGQKINVFLYFYHYTKLKPE